MVVTVGTNSYITELELQTYAGDRGITLTGDITIFIAKSMDYLETRNYIGRKTLSTQVLQFPRYFDYANVDNDIVPQRIKNAQCIAAILVGQGNDLQGNVERAVKRDKVDVLEVEYMDNAATETQYRSLNDALRPYVLDGARVVRV